MSTFEQSSSSFLSGDAVQVVNPSSGTTVVMKANARCLFVNNQSTLAALTVRLPNGAVHGQVVEVAFANPVTVLTVQDGLGAAAALDAPTSGAANSAQHYKFFNTRYGAGLAIRKWVYWK